MNEQIWLSESESEAEVEEEKRISAHDVLDEQFNSFPLFIHRDKSTHSSWSLTISDMVVTLTGTATGGGFFSLFWIVMVGPRVGGGGAFGSLGWLSEPFLVIESSQSFVCGSEKIGET